jgi:hypothetical protein
MSSAGLPDVLYSNQKFQLGKNFQGLKLENVDIFYGHLEHCEFIWHIVSCFGVLRQEKSGNTGHEPGL